MRNCVVCKNKINKINRPSFRVPKCEKRSQKWSAICGMALTPNSRLCIDHFSQSQIITAGRNYRLMPNAEPVMQNQQNEVLAGLPNLYDLNQPSQEYPDVTEIPIKMENTNAGLFQEQQTQTDSSICYDEINYYRNKIKELELENKELKCKLAQANLAVDSMKKIFTDGQIRKLMSTDNVHWKWRDISNAICIHASGPRAYKHLYHKGFPLPHIKTLQRWCGRVSVQEGVLSTAIEFMRHTTDMPLNDKICILAFDEMKVEESYEYDTSAAVVSRKPASYAQVVMARGLKKSWKLPVYYDFDCKMSKEIIYDLISKLSTAGFPVVGMVCDTGPTNRKLLRELGATPEKPWFSSPTNLDEKIFTFFDAPHLLKLIRNHFVDTGLIFHKTILSPRTISDLLGLTTKSDLSIAFKLNEEHISVKGAGRQEVKLAAQLFSNTTANAIRRCFSLGMEIYEAVETADFIQLVNDWFDVLNSKLSTFAYPGKEPYGISYERQRDTLSRMTQAMSFPIIPQHKSLEYFQRGIVMTNTALEMLFKYVEKYKMTYIITNRLNQDVLEHFFGAMRSKGGLNDHPSPQDFKYRLREYILARNTDYLSGKGNVENEPTHWLSNGNEGILDWSTLPDSGVILECDDINTKPEPIEEHLDLDESDLDDIGIFGL